MQKARARIMFGKNTQVECKIVKKLRKNELEIAEMYSGIFLVIIKKMTRLVGLSQMKLYLR